MSLQQPATSLGPSKRREADALDWMPSLEETGPTRDDLWDHCRNSLGIARLLVSEGRPDALAATACQMAAEAACRSALEHAGFPFDGDLARGLNRLSAPAELWLELSSAPPTHRLVAAERLVAWIAGYLRSQAPDRSWGY